MKFISIAALALLGQASAIQYKDSEGPTKCDYGENDDPVLQRADDSTNPDDDKWKKDNPLETQDDGEDDDTVLTMLDGSLAHMKRHAHKQSHKRRHGHHINSVLTMVDGSMRPIYDEDGDGVEDNVHKTHDELDSFYEPAVYGVAEDIYNTHHGNLPGHVRKAEYEGAPESEYEAHYHI